MQTAAVHHTIIILTTKSVSSSGDFTNKIIWQLATPFISNLLYTVYII